MKKGFSLVELLVVIAVIMLLIALLFPIITGARDQARRTVCVSNIRQLVLGWLCYCNDSGGKMPYAQVNESRGWVLKPPGYYPVDAPVNVQIQAIKNGSVFPYVSDTTVFRCPVAKKHEMRTYSSSHALNGLDFDGGPVMKHISQISDPARRLAFIDDFGEDWDAAWAVCYSRPAWWNPIPARHGPGTVIAYADGGAQYLLWKDVRTTAIMTNWEDWWQHGHNMGVNQTNNQDLTNIQLAVWGKLGY